MYALVTAIIAKDFWKSFRNFLRQLPVVNIWQNYNTARKIREYEKIIAEYVQKAENAKKKKIRDKFEAFANIYCQKLDELKSKHQIFKGYQAVFESGFQFILQIMIVFSKAKTMTKQDENTNCEIDCEANNTSSNSNDTENDWRWSIVDYDTTLISTVSHIDDWVWLSLSLSFLSMSATFSSLLLELPFQIGTKVYTPVRSLPQLFKLMAPMTLSLAVRLWYFIWALTLHTWEFAKYFIPVLLLVLLALASTYVIVRLWYMNQKLTQQMKEEAFLAIFTTAFLPCIQLFATSYTSSFLEMGNVLWWTVVFVHCSVAIMLTASIDWTMANMVFFILFLDFNVTSMIEQTNQIFVFKHAIDTNSRGSPLPLYKRSTMKNVVIPGEGLTWLSYAASKKHAMRFEKYLTKKEEIDCEVRIVMLCYGGCQLPDDTDFNKVGSIQSKRNQNTIEKIEKLEKTGNELKEFDCKTASEVALQQAQKLWGGMIDKDPFYRKSAFMISCQLKDVPSIEFFMSDLPEYFDFNLQLDYNLRDHKKRSGFILACQKIEDFDEDPQEETHLEIAEQDSNEVSDDSIERDDQGSNDQDDEDIEARKKVVKLFLEHAELLSIKLNCKDDQGKSGFDYIPEDWIEEFRTDYPQHFQS